MDVATERGDVGVGLDDVPPKTFGHGTTLVAGMATHDRSRMERNRITPSRQTSSPPTAIDIGEF